MNNLSELLQRTLSPDNDDRRLAEAQLEEASHFSNFLNDLMHALSLPGCSFAAVSYLKQTFPQRPCESQSQIVCGLLSLLETPGVPKAVVRLAASVVSRVVKHVEQHCMDAEDQLSEERFLSCFNAIRANVMEKVHLTVSMNINTSGAVREHYLYLLLEFVQDLDTKSFFRQDLMSELPSLLHWIMTPSLEATLRSAEKDSAFTLTVEVLRSAFATGPGEEMNLLLEQYFSALTAITFASTGEIVSQLLTTREREKILDVTTLTVEILTTPGSNQRVGRPAVMQSLINSLYQDVGLILSSVGDGTQEDDDLSHFVRRHSACRWVALCTFGIGKRRTELCSVLGNPDEMAQYCVLMMKYSYLRVEEAGAIISDPSSFFREEDDRSLQFPSTLRDAVAMTCAQHIKALGAPFVRVALDTFASILLEEDPSQTSQQREAALFFLQCIIFSTPQKIIRRELDASPLLLTAKCIIARDGVQGSPVQVARALVLLPRLLFFLSVAEIDTTPLRTELVSLAVTALLQLSSTEQQLVKISACKFLFHVIPMCLPEELSAILTSGLPPLSDMVLDRSITGECLYIVLETLSLLLTKYRKVGKTAPTLPDKLPPAFAKAIFSCWRNHLSDPSVGDLVSDIVSEALHYPLDSTFLTPELEWMQRIISSPGDELCVGPTLMRILTNIFRYGSAEVALNAVGLVLSPLVQLILSVEFTSILSVSLKCLAALLQRCPSGNEVTVQILPVLTSDSVADKAISLECGATQPLVTYPLTTVLTAVTLRILHPSLNESTLFDVKRSLVMIIQRVQDFSNEETSSIVLALTARLQSVKTGTVAQELLVPLATLFLLHKKVLLELLESNNQLRRVLELWLAHLPHFTGVRDILSSCQALLGLLQDPSALQRHTLLQWAPASRTSLVRAPRVGKRCGSTTRTLLLDVPLDAAIFATVGKMVGSLSEQWSDDECTSSASDSDAPFQESDDDDDLLSDEMSEAEEAEDPSLETITQRQSSLRIAAQDTFSHMAELGSRYGPVVAPFFTPTEMSNISSFLSSLQ